MRNKRRVAEVWLDDYKALFYKRTPGAAKVSPFRCNALVLLEATPDEPKFAKVLKYALIRKSRSMHNIHILFFFINK